MKDLIDTFKIFYTSPSIFIAILLVALIGIPVMDASTGLEFLFVLIPLFTWLMATIFYHIGTEKEKRGYNARRRTEEEYEALGKAMKVIKEKAEEAR